MGSVLSIDDVIENLKNAHDGATIEALDLRDDSDDQPDFREALERLRDSADGGFVLLLCSDNLSCEQVATRFEHLTHCFPVLDNRADDVKEGTLWAAVVAGVRGAPGIDPDSVSLLRAGELGPVPDATLDDLDLSLVGIRWPVPQSNKVWRKSVLRMIRRGIATQVDGQLRPTAAGLVALGRSPQTFLPGMRIELNTCAKEVCWRGSLPALLQKARYYRQPRLSSMPFALEEIVLNALLHRDWRPRYHNEPIRISFLERELVSTNPGLLDEDWRIGKLMPPNSALHALARRLRPSEIGDPGLQRIDAVLSGMELRPVTLQAKKNWIKVVVPWTEAPSARTDSSVANTPRSKSRKSVSAHDKARQESLTSNSARSQTPTSPPLPSTSTRPQQRVHPRDALLSQRNVSCEHGRTSPATRVTQVGMPPIPSTNQGTRQQTQCTLAYAPHQGAWTTAPMSAPHIPPAERRISPPPFETPAPATWPSVHGFPNGMYAYRHSQVSVRGPSPSIHANEPIHPIREPSLSSRRSAQETGRPPVQQRPVQEPSEARTAPAQSTSTISPHPREPNEAPPRPHPPGTGARPIEPHRSACRKRKDTPRRRASSSKDGLAKVGSSTSELPRSDQWEAQLGHKRSIPEPSISHRDPGGDNRLTAGLLRHDTTRQTTSDVVGHARNEGCRRPEERTQIENRGDRDETSVREESPSRRATPAPAGVTPEPASATAARPATSVSPVVTPPRNERDEAIIQRLRREGPQTTKQLMKSLKCTRWAIRTTLDRLMAANVMKAAAASSTSPNQTYELV